MPFDVFDLALRDGTAANGLSRAVNFLPVAADEMMPFGKVVTLVNQTIGTGFRQPFKCWQVRPSQLNAVRDVGLTVRIITAPASLQVEVATGDIGHSDLTRVRILELVETTFAATVA